MLDFPGQGEASELSPDELERFGPDPLSLFTSNLATVRERIERACDRVGRDPETVRLLPVTKTVPARVLRLAFAAGLRVFAENKIQEAQSKREALACLPIEWTIVGHLQTNKVRNLVDLSGEFHALDSLRLAEKLSERLEREDRSLDVYVQVNTSQEESKFGLHPDELPGFLEDLQRLPRLKPRGLMTLAVLSGDERKIRSSFRLLRALSDATVSRFPQISELSMGMSGDFEMAIEEGADVVRVGQAIFGPRPTPDELYWPER